MDNTKLNEELLSDEVIQEIAKARAKGTIANTTEPRAKSAYFDSNSGQIVIHLKYGSTFSFSPHIAQGLAGASPEDLAIIEITPSGDGLHWETLDADLSVPALLAGIYGNQEWMETLLISAVACMSGVTTKIIS